MTVINWPSKYLVNLFIYFGPPPSQGHECIIVNQVCQNIYKSQNGRTYIATLAALPRIHD